jgi:signal transduction histidine kinase/ActR/RegA family two-component response regulator
MPGGRGGRPRSIRSHLFQLLLVCVAPIGLLGAALLFLHWQAQENERERAQVETARLLAISVDNALDSTIQRLSIFASLWASAATEDAQIYNLAKSLVARNPDWDVILAFRPDGRIVFRLDQPLGADLGSMKLLDKFTPVVRENRALISDVFVSPQRDAKVVTVAVPVERDGRVAYVLMASLKLSWFDELLRKQGLPPGGVAGIFDANWKFLARSADGENRRGTDPAATLIRDMRERPEGIGKYSSLDSVPVYTSWTRMRHGWWVAYATPSQPIDGAFWRYLLLFGFLWLGAVIAAVVYAVSKGRFVTASLRSLQREAGQLARGKRLATLPSSRVEEVDETLRALEQASQVLERATLERGRALDTEREARAAAEAANHAKDEFIAMLGHELRNPLAAIWNAAAIVRSKGRAPGQLEFAGAVIARQSAHLKRLIDDLLDAGRVVTGKILLDRRPLDMATCVHNVLDTLRAAGRVGKRNIDVRVRSVWIDGDAMRIEQVITNLLANACTHTSAQGRIAIELLREDGDAVLRVSDDGNGIAAENLPRVFDLFFQAETTADRASGGLGIGLTLVQRLCRLHGGRAAARSAGKGCGASFEVRLPAVAAQAADVRRDAARVAAPLDVLLVEDNADERQTLRIALELHGHRVSEAADGDSALAQLRRHAPAVAVIDIGLPGGMDGYSLARRIRERLNGAVRLVALTGYGSPEDARRAREAGFDVHVAKPVDVVDLAGIIAAGEEISSN